MPIKAGRFSAVSPRRQQLIRMCQALNCGAFKGIQLHDGDPVLVSSLIAEERLDLPDEQRPEIQLADFNLSKEWHRLLGRFDQVQNGAIERLEVRAGIPRRVLWESRLPQLLENSITTPSRD